MTVKAPALVRGEKNLDRIVTTINLLQSNGADGDSVSGILAKFPSSTTDNAAARYSGSTGILQDSSLFIDDSGHISSFGGNIKFPATASDSADANTLDDYEEGTWTPTISFSTPGNLSVSYSLQSATYTKWGRVVYARFAISTSSFTHSTASGNLIVSGLPFSLTDTAGHLRAGALTWSGITKAGYTQIALTPATTTIVLTASGSGVSNSNVAAADMPTGGTVDIRGSILYH